MVAQKLNQILKIFDLLATEDSYGHTLILIFYNFCFLRLLAGGRMMVQILLFIVNFLLSRL